MYKLLILFSLIAIATGCQTEKEAPKKEVVVKKWTALIQCNYDSSHLGKYTVYGVTAADARKQARRIAQKHTDDTTHPAEVAWVKDEGPAKK